MTEKQRDHDHRRGATTGSAERAAQQLVGSLLAFDLGVRTAELQHERGWRDGDRSANTLVKAPDFRVVLTALRAGARLEEHEAAARVSIHTLSGHLRLHVAGEPVDLPAGHLLVLERDLAHDVEALQDSVFLLTIAWRADRAATE
jgi:quercetin dioxygenase-like cupin family protein